MSVHLEKRDAVALVTIDRVERRNAIDDRTADLLLATFERIEADAEIHVSVLRGAGQHFCAGTDLKHLETHGLRVSEAGSPPLGVTRLEHDKPVIGAIEGACVGGGLEIALWCDLRVAARDAVLGFYNRRRGLPCVDMGMVRLGRLVGLGFAMDVALTGRGVTADEAERHGLVNLVAEPGQAVEEALRWAAEIASLPQEALRADRRTLVHTWAMDPRTAMLSELEGGIAAMDAAGVSHHA
jgi:enoyl-CoA hydratase